MPEVGIVSTPVVDPASNTLYVCAETKEVANGVPSYVHRLHALSLTTGGEKNGGPVTIRASVRGTGDGSAGGVVPFQSFQQLQRPALLLNGGIVYLAFGSNADHSPYHGWVMGYDAKTLAAVSVFNATPDGAQGGIWQSGAGPAADDSGIYVLTGNGTFDVDQGGPDLGDSAVKLLPASALAVGDYFAPADQAGLNLLDLDLGAGGPLLVPDGSGDSQSGAAKKTKGPGAPRLLVATGKTGTIYLLDRAHLGGFTPGGSRVVQAVPIAVPDLHSAPAYFNGRLYFASNNDVLKAFTLTPAAGDAPPTLSTAPTAQGADFFRYPGSTPTVSADGGADDPDATAIVWVIAQNFGPILYAYAAADVSHRLYSSRDNPTRDEVGLHVKFSVPTVANGRVYVGTHNSVQVYGLL